MPPTDNGIPKSSVTKSGFVEVYDIPDKKWKYVPYIDAREMLEVKTACLVGPEVEMVGPAGRIRVCQVEVAKYEADGYKVVDGEELPERAKSPDDTGKRKESDGDEGDKHRDEDDGQGEEKSSDDGKPGEGKPQPNQPDFAAMDVASLKQLAAQKKVTGYAGMTKAQLIKALTA